MSAKNELQPDRQYPQQKLLTAKEVAVKLRLPLSTVYHLAKAGVLPAVQLGRTWRFPADDITALAEQRLRARVLVVDDDAVTRAFALEVLTGEGHTVVVAATAEEGLVAARQQRFDLLLIDFKLPGMLGTELIRKLRPDYSLKDMVLITAFADLVAVDELGGLSTLTILRKPLDAEGLRECADRIFLPRDHNAVGAIPAHPFSELPENTASQAPIQAATGDTKTVQ